MSRRHWRIVLAAIGLLVLSGLGYGSYQLYDASEQRQADYRYQPAGKPSLIQFVPTKRIPEGYQPNCQNPQTKEDSDLCAQWGAVQQVAEANRIGSLNVRLTILSLWGTLIATGLLIWNLVETRDTSRRELRAYVIVGDIQVGADVGNPANLALSVQAINRGQTPALEVKNRTFLMVRKGTVRPEPGREIESTTLTSVTTLGKDQDQWATVRQTLSHGHTPELLVTGDFTIIAYGYITYRDIFGKAHETRFSYFQNAETARIPQATPHGNSMT